MGPRGRSTERAAARVASSSTHPDPDPRTNEGQPDQTSAQLGPSPRRARLARRQVDVRVGARLVFTTLRSRARLVVGRRVPVRYGRVLGVVRPRLDSWRSRRQKENPERRTHPGWPGLGLASGSIHGDHLRVSGDIQLLGDLGNNTASAGSRWSGDPGDGTRSHGVTTVGSHARTLSVGRHSGYERDSSTPSPQMQAQKRVSEWARPGTAARGAAGNWPNVL